MKDLLKLNIQLFAEDDGTVKDDTVVTDDTVKDDKGTQSGDLKFSQADVDKIVTERIAREKKGLPSKEELDEFAQYKQNQLTEQEKVNKELEELRLKNKELDAKLSNSNKETLVSKSGAIDNEFVVFKVNSLVTTEKTFEEALKEYQVENPQYFQSGEKETKQNVDFTHKQKPNSEIKKEDWETMYDNMQK